jgi:hypothetical protein
MSLLPIKHMTLYKHGVGFFRRRGKVEGESLKLTFRREEMDDLLKSLTVVDHSGGQVRGVDYDTPQTREQKLEGCSVILDGRRSLRDLLAALRGREVRLNVSDGTGIEGTLLGLDEAEEKPLKRLLVSILQSGGETTAVVGLDRLEGVEIKDTDASEDLRFFLRTAAGRETHRSITIRFNSGSHDLEVSYIAPAPGWRVSYRLVMEEKDALLQGWGIFDNRLEEDLSEISLSLTAGMPISFIYDLYTPHTPKRPVVKEEDRVAAAPLMFAAAAAEALPPEAEMPAGVAGVGGGAPMMAKRHKKMMRAEMEDISLDALSDSIQSTAKGEDLGELFQYKVAVPVTVGRGQSAMVPIINSRLKLQKDLIYNRSKMEGHPAATLRFKNTTGLTLERGPVTVLESSEYVGEAVLPFTADSAEAVISYAIELGVHIREEEKHETQLHGLNIKNQFLVQQIYDIRVTRYRVDNRTSEAKIILLERSLDRHYETFDTAEPAEKTIDTVRYKMEAEAGKLTHFTVKARRLRLHQQQLRLLTYQNLQNYFENKFLDKQTYAGLKELLAALAEVGKLEHVIKQQEQQQAQIYKSQEQIRNKMGVLAKDGEEGRLRGRYVKQLTGQEEDLAAIDKTISDTRAEIERKNTSIAELISGLEKK